MTILEALTYIEKWSTFGIMLKHLEYRLLYFLVLLVFPFCSCEKEAKYDLFPLKVGNEFYYTYYKYHNAGLPDYINGNETWKISSETLDGNSVTYIIERKLNAIRKFLGNTIIISDSITCTSVVENRSSHLITFFGHTFQRFQDVPRIEFTSGTSTMMPGSTLIFRADSGLTKYYYYDPPNIVTTISLTLDSLNTSQ